MDNDETVCRISRDQTRTGRPGLLDRVDSKVTGAGVDEVDNEGDDYYKNLVSKTLSKEVSHCHTRDYQYVVTI